MAHARKALPEALAYITETTKDRDEALEDRGTITKAADILARLAKAAQGKLPQYAQDAITEVSKYVAKLEKQGPASLTDDEVDQKLFDLDAAPEGADVLRAIGLYAGIYINRDTSRPWRPSTDFETATEMLERVAPKLSKIQTEVKIHKSLVGEKELWFASLEVFAKTLDEGPNSGWAHYDVYADTPALALSLATLTALEDMNGKK